MTPRQEKHLKTGKIEIPIILVRTMVTKEEFKQILTTIGSHQNRHYGLSRHVFSFRNCISNPRLSSSLYASFVYNGIRETLFSCLHLGQPPPRSSPKPVLTGCIKSPNCIYRTIHNEVMFEGPQL